MNYGRKVFYDIGPWQYLSLVQADTVSANASMRETKSCLGKILNYKLGCFFVLSVLNTNPVSLIISYW